MVRSDKDDQARGTLHTTEGIVVNRARSLNPAWRLTLHPVLIQRPSQLIVCKHRTAPTSPRHRKAASWALLMLRQGRHVTVLRS